MIVCKFGGTSVQDAEAIARTADIIRARIARRPVVVVSALGGVTNELLDVANRAATGNLLVSLSLVEALRERHLRTVAALLDGSAERDEVEADVSAGLDELAHLAEALNTLGFVTPRSLDTVAAIGELLSSRIVAAAFRHRGLEAEWVDARDVMITDDHFTRATPDTARIATAAREHVRSVVHAGRVPVLGGFVGATPEHITTTLGRGGSDYSASLIGAALEAEAIEIWTDVDGMLTADPRIIPSARLIERIRFDEAAELAAFGAKVLHPSTIAPAVDRGIPVYIFNSRRPDGTGTMITFDAPRLPVRAIAGKRGKTLVRIGSARMLLAHGFLSRVFAVFERHRTSIDVVTTSEVSVSVTLDDATHLESIIADLSAFGDVAIEQQRGLVAVVGAGLADGAATMAQCLAAIHPIAVHMVSLSATGINFTLVIDDAQVVPAMQRLHAAFFPEGA
ncbi:MAG TPA: lysine-sensitive aspartokinase 3 [Gemmatimonadaceae bacterium]|nr:lysine-sensitive aspartokinase 3 [Gemmatimonadaceae bacterium]